MSDLRIEKLSMESTDITQENINKIKELFPQVVTEGKIDFDVLKTILGEQIENQNERYQFTWNGKSETIRFAQKPSTGTLRPDKESSKNWDTTENLYIEGDNLEVLKLLQKTYHNKIKMIYIDPPYNTGGDFVYKDDFKDSIKNYKEQTNQTLRTNPETSGRYHTDWLNMMYSRLMLAKNLLTDDGVIFVSINDNEVTNMQKLGEEIFGEDQLEATFVWKNKYGPGAFTKGVASLHEYILCFSKNKLINIETELSEEEIANYSLKDDKYSVRGGYITQPLATKSKDDRPNLVYPLIHNNVEIWPDKQWIWEKNRLQKAYEANEIVINHNKGKYSVRFKQYLKDENGRVRKGKPLSLITNPFNQEGTKEVEELFTSKVFDFPKPSKLIKKFINYIINNNYENNFVILDFFSGSSSTAQAVMQLNAEDGGNRKFIMVQLPEKTDEKSEAFKAGYNNICEIGKERIRRAGEKIKSELIDKNQKAGMLDDSVDPEKLDIGFKVYKLDSSNFNVFDSSSKDINNIFNHDVFLSDRSKLDILYEILLKYGVFDKPVEVLNINNKEAYSVAFGHMLVFINQEITEQDITEVVALKPREVIIDERGFKTDNDKMNAVIRLEAAGVEKISTI